MKHLIEVSKIVTRKKVKKIEIFDEHSLKHKNSKFNEFYDALLESKFKNDRDAAAFLYNCSPTDDKYRQLKSRFRKRLLNTLFFLDVNQPAISGYNRAYYSCNKDWTLVKILLSNGANHTAANLAKHILTIALKFKFADIIVNCSRILREYCSQVNEEKEYEEYDQYSKQFQDVLAAEIRSEELYQRVIMNYLKPASKNQNLTEKIDTYCDALVGLSEVYDSPVVYYNMFMVWIYRFEMLNDYDSMLEVCERAEKYIEDNPNYYRDDKLQEFLLKKLTAYLHKVDYKNGKITIEKALKNIPDTNDEWFVFMRYYMMLAMHSDNYIGAIANYNTAVNNPRFRRINTTEREIWNIFDIYLNYIIEVEGENNPILRSQRRRSFRLARFLTNPILYPSDQRIFTVFLLIAQFLFLIDKKNLGGAAERVTRLKNYANRQLKKEEYYRLIQFIKLLQQLSRAEFQPENMTNSEKYYNRLLENPFKYRGLLSEMEIIPYEKLWGMILKKLNLIIGGGSKARLYSNLPVPTISNNFQFGFISMKIPFGESFLQYVWKFSYFDTTQLLTHRQEPLTILENGQYNAHAGADFQQAKIRIGETIWAGNIEIHLRASDWNTHQHQKDANYYNSVILHVVYENDILIKRPNGEEIPVLILKNRIPPTLLENAKKLQDSYTFVPCEQLINRSSAFTQANWLDRLLIERLERKTQSIRERLAQNQSYWEQTFYEFVARAFGLKINAEPFEVLARNTPLLVLAKHKNNPLQIEALVFGQAGFLDDEFEEAYPKILQKEYQYLKNKYQLHSIQKSSWKFFRLRPSNFPSLRLAQFAALIHQSVHLFSKIIEAKTVDELYPLFSVQVISDYWHTHYVFDKKVEKVRGVALSKNIVDIIIVNTIIPFLFFYGSQKKEENLKERSLKFLEKMEAEKNTLIDEWQKILSIPIKNACHSQALLELKNEYCAKMRCLDCAIGNALMKYKEKS